MILTAKEPHVKQKTAMWAELYRPRTETRILINFGLHEIETPDEYHIYVQMIEYEIHESFPDGWQYSIFYGPQEVFKKLEESRLTCDGLDV
jgi:hypothetical protein